MHKTEANAARGEAWLWAYVKNYYTILGLDKSASDEEIKKAYRKLAHKHHPDKPGGNEAKFKEVNEAYQVLGTKEKRMRYDRFGHEEGVQGSPFGGGDFGFDPGNIWSNVQWDMNVDGAPNIEDVFEGFFGGGARGHTAKKTRGSDIEIIQEINLEEAYTGVKRSLEYKTYIQCETCGGKGYEKSAKLNTCGACGGSGSVQRTHKTLFGTFARKTACDSCAGAGQIPDKLCPACKGEGRIYGRRIINLEISPGIEDGQIMSIGGKGEAGKTTAGRDSESGDVFIVVRIRPHKKFMRKKDDLIAEKSITVTEALLSKKTAVQGIDGEIIYIVIPPDFNFQEPLRVPGKGMPRFGHYRGPSAFGDLYITLNLKMPKKVSGKAKKLLEELDSELLY